MVPGSANLEKWSGGQVRSVVEAEETRVCWAHFIVYPSASKVVDADWVVPFVEEVVVECEERNRHCGGEVKEATVRAGPVDNRLSVRFKMGCL